MQGPWGSREEDGFEVSGWESGQDELNPGLWVSFKVSVSGLGDSYKQLGAIFFSLLSIFFIFLKIVLKYT